MYSPVNWTFKSMEFKLGLNINWPSVFQKTQLESKVLLSFQRGGVSKSSKISIFPSIFTPTSTSNSCNWPVEVATVKGFTQFLAGYLGISLKPFLAAERSKFFLFLRRGLTPPPDRGGHIPLWDPLEHLFTGERRRKRGHFFTNIFLM